MPIIQSVLRIQFGGQSSPLISNTSLQVDSIEEVTLSVDGAPTAVASKPGKNGKISKVKPSPKSRTLTYKHVIADVKFVAIYDAGQGSGLRIKIGNGKMESLRNPIILMEGKAASFGRGLKIVLENDSPVSRTAVMMVGSDKAKTAFKQDVIAIAKLPKPKG
jgi:hypothetical protein